MLTVSPAAAVCVEPSLALLDTSDVAFSGVVTKRWEAGDDVITTVRVDRVFKGEVTRRVDVVSRVAGTDPGADYSVHGQTGDGLVVFGDLVEDEVTSNVCRSVSGVSELDEQYYDPFLAELGEGTAPSPGYMRAERRTFGLSYDQFVAGRAILGVLSLSCLAYFAYRAWRGRRRTD
ncbi:hypothetical protein [Nocardioides sp.]|uniref:hypothetical protein n=1 Tax=Nocardioides sp. TaxID=35761 RepID=UPI002D7F9ED3|nr:hypothetical protein [Nocardioides sp.]